MHYPIHEYGGEGPILHMAIANGFPPPLYIPFLQPFMQHFHVVSLPPKALWQQDPPPQRLYSWKETVTQDFLAGIQQHNLKNMIGFGHSIGGVMTLLAALKAPERFKALVLLDPVILPRPLMWAMRIIRHLHLPIAHPLAKKTMRRKDVFDDQNAAYTYFRDKRAFADWSDTTIRLYADSMQPSPDGRVTLAWPKEWEVFYYKTIYTGTWGVLPGLNQLGLPILIIRAENSDTLFPKAAAQVMKLMPSADYAEIKGQGHLFPQAAPEETSQIIMDWMLEKELL